MPIGKDKGDLAASFDGGEGEAGLHLIQADAQILELAEGVIEFYGEIIDSFFSSFYYFYTFIYMKYNIYS